MTKENLLMTLNVRIKFIKIFYVVLATPAVRHLIKSYKLDHKLITPTGRNNRIMKGDVIRYMENLDKAKEKAKPTQQKDIKETTKLLKPSPSTVEAKLMEEDKVVKLTGFQKAMTKTMTIANLIPSFLYTDEFNVDKLVKIRKEFNSSGSKVKVTFTPFFIKAVSMALLEFPILNSHVNPNLGEDGFIKEFIIKKDHNISVAIDSPEGLVVPNIKRVQDKSILQIQNDLNGLKERSEARKLTNDDLTNGTFTVSNIGNCLYKYFFLVQKFFIFLI